MTEEWKQREALMDIDMEFTRVDDYTGQEAILWKQQGDWALWFADPVKGSYRGLGLGEHATAEQAMTAADGAIQQARETVLRRIDHYRTPLPHIRMQVARFNDGHLPTVYVYDHVVVDSLHDIPTKDMDCRYGRTPDQAKVDLQIHEMMGNQELDEPDLDDGMSIGD